MIHLLISNCCLFIGDSFNITSQIYNGKEQSFLIFQPLTVCFMDVSCWALLWAMLLASLIVSNKVIFDHHLSPCNYNVILSFLLQLQCELTYLISFPYIICLPWICLKPFLKFFYYFQAIAFTYNCKKF